jgi:hypothetical protein
MRLYIFLASFVFANCSAIAEVVHLEGEINCSSLTKTCLITVAPRTVDEQKYILLNKEGSSYWNSFYNKNYVAITGMLNARYLTVYGLRLTTPINKYLQHQGNFE